MNKLVRDIVRFDVLIPQLEEVLGRSLNISDREIQEFDMKFKKNLFQMLQDTKDLVMDNCSSSDTDLGNELYFQIFQSVGLLMSDAIDNLRHKKKQKQGVSYEDFDNVVDLRKSDKLH